MCASKLRRKQQSVSERDDATPEIDVLDRWPSESLVIATHASKHRRAHASQASPERRGLSGANLVNIGVGQILELRHEIPLGRVQIVGTEHPRYLGFVLQQFAHPGQSTRSRHDIGVHEEQNIAGRVGGRSVARRGWSRRSGHLDDGSVVSGGKGSAVFTSAVGGDQNFCGLHGLARSRKTPVQLTDVLMEGNDDRGAHIYTGSDPPCIHPAGMAGISSLMPDITGPYAR